MRTVPGNHGTDYPDNIDGMILLSELSRRRIRSIQKLIRVGRNEVVVVLRVDKDKGYIDLSKRRVSPEDIVKCEERYNKSKMVHSIMRHVAEKTNTPIEELYQSIGWPLNKKYGHSIDAFKLSITNPDVWNDVSFPNEVVKEELQSYIGKRLTPQPTKVRSDIEVTCFGYEGIDAVKTALRKAEAKNTPDNQVKVKLVSPPLYGMQITIHAQYVHWLYTNEISAHIAMSRQEPWHRHPRTVYQRHRREHHSGGR
jgi:translation initiation factor 2 subunit 1